MSREADGDVGSTLAAIRAAAGDPKAVVDLFKSAEKAHLGDMQAMVDLCKVAWESYGEPKGQVDFDFQDLCVKRLRALCRHSPTDAREFHNNVLRKCSIGRGDARIYEARAEMEERLGDAPRAIKLLEEGIRVGATPTSVLNKCLQRLQEQPQQPPPAPAVPAPAAGAAALFAGLRGGLDSGLASAPGSASASSSRPALLLPTALSRTQQPSTAPQVPPANARPLYGRNRGRRLGLGSPKRRSEFDEEDEDSDEDVRKDAATPSAPSSRAAPPAQGADAAASMREGDGGIPGLAKAEPPPIPRMSFTAASMSLVPLSPIHEENEARCSVSSHGARKSYGDHRDSLTQPRAEELSAARLAAAVTPEPPAARGPPEAAEGASAVPQAQAAAAAPVPGGRADAAPAGASTPESAGSGSPAELPSAAAERPEPVTPARPAKIVHVNGVPYTVLEVVGRGGSSKVFAVLSPTGQRLALKRVDTDNMKQLEAFENEVGLLQQLKHCEQVVHVVDAEVNRERGRITIVMEAGEADLNRYLHSCKELSLEQIQRLWRQMIEAVQVVHAERIVHSDLKPANFLMVNGRVKIIDFGIAKRISCDTTNIQRENSVGTLSYMAPEAVKQGKEGVKLGRASDIWALGIILYQMVYGRPPMASMEAYEKMVFLCNPALEIEFPPGHILDGHCAETRAQLLDIMGRCLQRDPRRRPSLTELLEHPFLRSSAEVSREAVHGAVSKLMDRVMRLVGFPESAIGPWQALSGEVWEELLRQSGGSVGGSSSSAKAAPAAEGWRPFEDPSDEPYPEGLAFLEEMAHHFAGPLAGGAAAGRRAGTADAEAAARTRAQALLEDSDEDGEPTGFGLGMDMAPPGNTGPLQRHAAAPPGSTGPLNIRGAPPGSTGPLPAAPLPEVDHCPPARPPPAAQPPARGKAQDASRRAPLAEIPKKVHRAEGYRDGGGAWKGSAPPAASSSRAPGPSAEAEKENDAQAAPPLPSKTAAAASRKVANAPDASALAAPQPSQAPKKLAPSVFSAFGGRGAGAQAGAQPSAARATPASLLESSGPSRPRPGVRAR